MDDALAALRASFDQRLELVQTPLDRAVLARAEALEPAHDASAPHPDGPEAEPAKVRG